MLKLGIILGVLTVYASAILLIVAPALTFKYHDINPVFQNYTDDFYALLAKTCPDKVKYEVNYYTIKFSKPEKKDDWIGVCEHKLNGYIIRIDPEYWESRFTSEEDKRQLLYHELSHCVIYRDHVEDESNYMNPFIMKIPGPIVQNQVISNMEAYCNER